MDRDALTVVPEAAAAPTIRPSVRANAFRALRSKPFRWYFAGQIASASGTFVQATAIGWLVLQLTGSPASLGMVLAAGGVPPLLLGPWGGVVDDLMVVRGEATSTPVAEFWGAAPTGKSFRTMAIDVFTVRDGKLATATTSRIGRRRSSSCAPRRRLFGRQDDELGDGGRGGRLDAPGYAATVLRGR